MCWCSGGFDAKGDADSVFAEAGVPTTYLLTAFYWENFIYFGMGPKKGADGKLALTLPICGYLLDRRLYTEAFGMVALLPIIGTAIWWLFPVRPAEKPAVAMP